jgi:hypothetical protein
MSKPLLANLRRREVVNEPAYGADQAVDGEADDRDLHDAHQHDGEVAVSNFPQAQGDRVMPDKHEADSAGHQRDDNP